MSDNNFHPYLAAMLDGWGYPVGDLAGTTVLGVEGIGLDSMALMELQTRVYTDHGIVLEDEELAAIGRMTLDELVALLDDRRGDRS